MLQLSASVQVNEGLSDSPSDALDYSLKQDIETVLAQGKRIAGAMIRYFEHAGKAAVTHRMSACLMMHIS